jgi:hypothetical protein
MAVLEHSAFVLLFKMKYESTFPILQSRCIICIAIAIPA